MKISFALFIFCCFVLVQKVAAQVAATDSASAQQSAKPASRADLLRTMRDRRRLLPMSAPFPGQPPRDARYDARLFRLPKDLLPKVRDGEIATTSDYFKPTAASTSVPELLADSAYVKDYRFYAYNNGSRQMIHPVRTGLIIGGSVLVAVSAIIAIIIAFSHVHIGQVVE